MALTRLSEGDTIAMQGKVTMVILVTSSLLVHRVNPLAIASFVSPPWR